MTRSLFTVSAVLAFSVALVAQTPAQTARPRAVPPRPAPAAQAGETIAITNARVLPVSGPAIERGTVLIRGGRIAAVGASVTIPPDARTIDATGKIVTPGWLDSGTQTGTVEIPLSAEGTADQVTTDARISAA